MSLNGKHLITLLGELAACAAAPAAGGYHHRELIFEVADVGGERGDDEGEEVMRHTLGPADVDELRYALQQVDWSDTRAGLIAVMRQVAAGERVDDIALVMERTPPEPVAIEEMVFA